MIPTPETVERVEACPETESSHVVRELPVLVLSAHNRCNCRCMMCDIWKIRQTREISAADMEPHLESLRQLRVRWVVLSGGEPLLHSDLAGLTKPLRAQGIRVTFLTAGLILEQQAPAVAENADDLIVSLDGPEAIHDDIRGVPRAFARLARGISALRNIRPAMAVAGRCTVQKRNFRCLRATVNTARQLEFNSVSFLAADVVSEAFNRPQRWPQERQASIALDADDLRGLEDEIEALIRERRDDIESGFVAENAVKLRRIALHFRAQLGLASPVAPRCNAPWVSAVVDADGAVRPCFFHPPFGNLSGGTLHQVMNGPEALRFRRSLKVFSNPTCRRCVCPLYIPPPSR